MSQLLTQMAEDLYYGDEEAVARATQEALESGLSPHEILADGLIAGMNVVGKDFRECNLFLPEVLAAAKAMHAGMAILRPLLSASDSSNTGTVLLGTVKGDVHDIGKNLLGMMMAGAGFEVIDLGVDVPVERFVSEVEAREPDIVGVSALLTTTMGHMKTLITALEQAGLRERVKVMVGGAPVTDAYAEEIGADGFATNASAAVERAKVLLGRG
ncbi:MAG TPA: cobalamin-binding protein [Chloroflexi bacterium]|nr:cobalamin-binding protein [Chloroflexota bacterium]